MRVAFNRVVLVFSLLVYSSVLLPPSYLWLAGFLSYSIPFVVVFNFILLVYYITLNKRVLLYPLVSLIAAFPFIRATIAINPNANSVDADFSVLSYNVRYFKDAKAYNYGNFSPEMMHWVLNDSSKIKCFQEFYSHPEYPNLDMLNRLKANNYYNHYINLTPDIKPLHGLSIYSKFPIIEKGVMNFGQETFNGGIYADILVQNDTIRIYNIHLRSMGLDSREILSPEIKEKYKDIAWSLRAGFIARAQQVQLIAKHIKNCPYPVILCGDLNDMPYSYTYFKLRRNLTNTFEASGNGFGFTYNGRLSFLRIDNQFYDEHFKSLYLEVENNAENSDHFPVKGYYIKKEK